MQFTEVVGQSLLKTHFIEEIRRNHFAHAKLLVGSDGFGTLALSLAYARYIFCENKSDIDSCNSCSSCKKMSILQHPDLHFAFPTILADKKLSSGMLPKWREKIFEDPYFDINQWTHHIDPSKGRKPLIGTDESLEIINALSLKSYEGGYKIMLIWGVDQMNESCANKLLKILEEPPSHTLFLLTATNLDFLLPTILSRTQLVRVPRISSEDLQQYLEEKLQIGPQNAHSIVSLSDGNLITAKSLIDQHQSDDNLHLFIDLMRAAYLKDPIKMIQWAETIGSQTKEQQTRFLQYGLHLLRQSLLKNYSLNNIVALSKHENDFLSNFAQFITGKNIVNFHELFNKSHYYIERNGNAKIIFTNLSFDTMRYLVK